MSGPPSLPSPIPERLAAGAFLLIDKPRGPTSHQVTAWVRDVLGVAKAGHAGTLDPNVSGLLWVGVGPALKLIPLVLEFPKRYVGVMAFHGPVPAKELDRVVAEFVGPVYQTPPVRSAVRRERRVRTIHRLAATERAASLALLDVTADSGTYVRTLAVDLGEALGVGGHLEELRRVGTGPFREGQAVAMTGLADAVSRAQAGATEELEGLLHPMKEVWGEFPVLRLKDVAASAIAHGARLASGGVMSISRTFSNGSYVVLASSQGELVAFGTALVDSDQVPKTRHGWVVDPERVLADPTRFPPRWESARTRRPKAAPAHVAA